MLPFGWSDLADIYQQKSVYDKLDEEIPPIVHAESLKYFPNTGKEKENIENDKGENEAWKKINKKSIKAILAFLKGAKSEKVISEANSLKSNLLDQKVKSFLSSKYPFAKKYFDSIVYYPDGETSESQFYHLFRSYILGINPETGFKALPIIKEKGGEVVWLIADGEEGIYLHFRPFKNRMVLSKITQKKGPLEFPIEEKSYNFVASQLFSSGWNFPNDDNLDMGFIEK
ncbi:hypothetical protein LEP1GSC050_4151 [Leptospira broomii serovar Hurstbridge str. 5399]|uniref:Uncharacterized protein n=1 Tax=Leptospira broomii serovar Hurstbridge str. 5399 TaxID=1049789 RepID=T0F1I2_9LEPT|nr:hypothetical protein [Leptospira broomii]EQA44985.1 hypothetical protein LEP1GSC050_4151 [Leptospira broomii serovar Hurstbridge str. 5399]